LQTELAEEITITSLTKVLQWAQKMYVTKEKNRYS